MSDCPFTVGQQVRVRPGRSRDYPELDEQRVYTVTATGVNTFPQNVMRSTHWVKIDPPTVRIVFWGTDMFEAAPSSPPSTHTSDGSPTDVDGVEQTQ